MSHKRILVTGGSGFIGSAFVRYALTHPIQSLVNLDLLTYAANPHPISDDPRYIFIKGDINDQPLLSTLIETHHIDTIVHFAAESHVDNSIANPRLFYETNIGGTIALLEAVRRHPSVHFHHVSTDEVFGALGSSGTFTETSPYRPNSPYAASKASSDHFVRAYAHTYNLSTTLSHCTNNYGPHQHREKLIPTLIHNCLERKPLPIYGSGRQVRDWLFVDDHVRALWLILEKGAPGETYAIGGGEEAANLDIAHLVAHEVARQTDADPHEILPLITHVTDRPGHDFRYAIDPSKAYADLGWQPQIALVEGIKQTVAWTLNAPVARASVYTPSS